ncbi:MAG: hypothetical protein HY905_16490 [Deltaproteobacteria bacterium]|nr:hypothetical protein [Deltaproteobacteria bacterium]
MRIRAFAGTVSAVLVVAAVATALAQVAPDEANPAEPTAGDAGTGTATVEPETGAAGELEGGAPATADAGGASEPEQTATADAGAPPEPDAAEDVTATQQPEAAAETSTPRIASDADISRVVQRRREAALVGGWVHSSRDEAAGRFVVDDLQLDATGQFTRRQSGVDADTGMATPSDESTGTWFTEEGTLVLLAQGSAIDEVLRAAFQIDDRSETLVVELPGGPASYFRYR